MLLITLTLLIIKHLYLKPVFAQKLSNCERLVLMPLLLRAVTNPKIFDAIKNHKGWFCYLGQAQLFDRVTFLGFFIECPYI